MIKNKIYFVENFHGIQYFLSLINLGEQNLIVTSGNPNIEKFLDEILSGYKRIIIPRIPCYHYFILPILLLYWRFRYSNLFSKRNASDVYFFSKGNNLHFFVVFAKLQKYGYILHYIDGSGGKFIEIPIQETSWLKKLYNWMLSISCGQNLVRYKCWGWIHFGLKQFQPESIKLLEWEEIANKFKFLTKKIDNAILFIDAPIQDIPGVDVYKTQNNLMRFISHNITKEIHLKMHTNCEYNSFSGTFVENEVKILPRHIPAEFFILQYSEIYFFASASCYGHKGKKLYSLSNMLVFDTEESKINYWKLFNDYFPEKNIFLVPIPNTNE